MDILKPKIAIITPEQVREIHGKEWAKDSFFAPKVDKDGNIFISEGEIEKMPPSIYPWKKDLILQKPNEILKDLTKEEWLVQDKLEYEKRLQEIETKLGNSEIEIIK
jgi:hypothetical protein